MYGGVVAGVVIGGLMVTEVGFVLAGVVLRSRGSWVM
jgi:hypothetical protein